MIPACRRSCVRQSYAGLAALLSYLAVDSEYQVFSSSEELRALLDRHQSGGVDALSDELPQELAGVLGARVTGHCVQARPSSLAYRKHG